MQQFYVETFGCTANVSASELMSYLLLQCGYKKTTNIKEADFILVNTCIVKSPTESKIKDLLLKFYIDYPLIVAGCLPQVLESWCVENIPRAALIGVDNFNKICEATRALINNLPYRALNRDSKFCNEIQRERVNPITAIIEISKGCKGSCSYCIVKLAKGKLVSKQKSQITLEAKNAILEGCKEIWLTAQDTASYGEDLGVTLTELLDELSAIQGNFMIRIGMMNPDSALRIVDSLKNAFENPKVYNFLHLPVQSGSNRILEKMKRKYSIEDFILLVKSITQSKTFALSTDIITGFPTENECDFQKTLDLFNEIQFDIVNISKYGDRPYTVASYLQNKIPSEIIKQRSTLLSNIVEKMTLERNKRWVKWKGPALAIKSDIKNSYVILRNKSYKLIAIKDSNLTISNWYNVEITKALKTRLLAKVI